MLRREAHKRMPPEYYQDDFDLFIEEFRRMQQERGKGRLAVSQCWPAWLIEAEGAEPPEELSPCEGQAH